jgi:MFS family permease
MLDRKMSALRPWVVTLTAFLFTFFVYIQANLFNSVSVYLLKEFNLTATQLGRLSSYYFVINVLFLFPAGILLDRFSPYKIILFSMLSGIIGTIIFSISHTFPILIVSRVFVGISGISCFVACLKIASRWFPPHRMALMAGLLVTMAMLGGMIAQTPFALLTDAIGWRNTSLIDAGIGVLIMLVIAILVRDFPPGNEEIIARQKQELSKTSFFTMLKKVALNPQNIFGGLFIALLNLPAFLLGAMWGGLYLIQARGLTYAQSSLVNSMLFLGLIIGSPLSGWLSDNCGRRKMPMIFGALAALLISIIIIFAPSLSFVTLLLLFFSLGMFMGIQIIGYPLISESNATTLTGTATGLASVFIVSAGFTQLLFGWLLGLHWQHTMVNGAPIYAVSDYRLAMLILPAGFLIALVSALLCKETYCSRKNES